ISPLIGTAEITIREWASTDTPPLPSQPASATGTIEVTKFPPGFYCKDFKASPAEIERGGGVTLTWNASSNADCELEYGQNKWSVRDQSCTVPSLNETTVFTLTARGVQDGQTVILTQSTTVVVLNPGLLDFHAQPDRVAFTNPRQQLEL